MKILYAVQATGNGHISRAHEILPYLTQYGNVDVMLSGSNATLKTDFDVKYRSPGLSLFYSTCGGLDFIKIISKIKPRQIYKDISSLPIKKYDFVINDFDFITSQACKKHNIPCAHLGHQASFSSDYTPRPNKKSFLGELILKNYTKAHHNIGLHFDTYDKNIFYPIIKESIVQSRPTNPGHISVYLPAYEKVCIQAYFFLYLIFIFIGFYLRSKNPLPIKT